MKQNELVSVIIANYNYARYLLDAVTSIRRQTYAPIEIIIVDDGSTDDSRNVIEAIDCSNLKAVFTHNQGQAAAWNEGMRIAKGSFVIFLDADDTLLPLSIEQHVRAFQDPTISRSQGYLAVTDAFGRATGERVPTIAPIRDSFDSLLTFGPGSYVCAPTSGNCWQRQFLDRVFPLPEVSFGADALLFDSAPLYGKSAVIDSDVATYRQHGQSVSNKKRTADLNGVSRWLDERHFRIKRTALLLNQNGYQADDNVWSKQSWREHLMLDLRARLKRDFDRPPFGRTLLAVASAKISLRKRITLLILIFIIRITPLFISLPIAMRICPL